ncbi:MAG: heparinase II/III family protein [Pirellulales bacterium]
MSVRDLPRVMRTIRHLNWSQPMWRLLRQGQRRFEPFVVSLPHGTNSTRIGSIDTLGRLPAPPRSTSPLTTLDLLQRGQFHHLSQTQHVGRTRPDWRLDTQRRDRLWSVTLHYHRWLVELASLSRGNGKNAARAASVLTDYWVDWIRQCDVTRPAARPLAWNSYAIATRLQWWVQSIRLLGRPFFDARPDLWRMVVTSMWRQATFLSTHLEWDLCGNHLMRDAVGLAWAGRFFASADRSSSRCKTLENVTAVRPTSGRHLRIDRAHDRQAARWLETATRLAAQQAAEQVLADGGHFERSPMYHLEVMEDLSTLAGLLRDPLTVARLRQTLCRMTDFAAWLAHPDGELVQLNDGERRDVRQAIAWAGRMGHDDVAVDPRGGRHFAQTGLVVWHDARWSVFFDVGQLGPACQPGHGHADTLTVDVSVAGNRLFVDPGSYGYDHDARRRYDRSTAAHNSVCIDNTDSSEVWHIFRVGRRAHPFGVGVAIGADALAAEAAHDGYHHLPGRPCHRRRIAVRRGGHLEIVDQIDGDGQHGVQGGWLLDPQWRAEPAGGGWRLRRSTTSVRVRIETPVDLSLAIEPACIHPYYGAEQQTCRLVWRYQGAVPITVRTVVEAT